MEYGCIGEHLSHSFSKEIHNALADYKYELKELSVNEVQSFIVAKNFKAINVTIPYKETVIPFLDYISDEAKQIGAVNTIVNKNGKLYGYNTDFFGMKNLILKAKMNFKSKTVAILGGGGTAKTAYAVSQNLGAEKIFKVSRTEKNGFITYETLYEISESIDVLINTTPVGMFPNIFVSPVKVEKFKNLSAVVDAVYNPLNSKLVFDAKKNNVNAVGGLFMLVSQAAEAVEKFIDTKISFEKTEEVFNKIFLNKENIVLIGMPSSGKTTVGKILSEKLNKPFFDSDVEIEKLEDKTVSDIFKNNGEAYFRKIENKVIFELSKKNSSIISTGGGAILNAENIELLKENGKVFFLDRPLNLLEATNDRPLSSNKSDLEKRFKERYPLYMSSADVKIDASVALSEVVNQILEVQK